jgi:hypothetical protein
MLAGTIHLQFFTESAIFQFEFLLPLQYVCTIWLSVSTSNSTCVTCAHVTQYWRQCAQLIMFKQHMTIPEYKPGTTFVAFFCFQFSQPLAKSDVYLLLKAILHTGLYRCLWPTTFLKLKFPTPAVYLLSPSDWKLDKDFLQSAVLFLYFVQKYYLNKSCRFLEDLLPYTISGLCIKKGISVTQSHKLCIHHIVITCSR